MAVGQRSKRKSRPLQSSSHRRRNSRLKTESIRPVHLRRRWSTASCAIRRGRAHRDPGSLTAQEVAGIDKLGTALFHTLLRPEKEIDVTPTAGGRQKSRGPPHAPRDLCPNVQARGYQLNLLTMVPSDGAFRGRLLLLFRVGGA
jgi:hypothetical protein